MKECLIYGILGGFIGSLYMGWLLSSKSPYSKDPSLALVDMQELIAKKSQQLAMSQSFEKSEKSKPIREAAVQLKEDLNTFATNNNLILLTKGIVVSSNLPDKTEEILAMMERGNEHP